MGKNLTRITKCSINATTWSLTFEKIVEDEELLEDGIDMKQPDIFEKKDVEIISGTRLDIQDIEKEVESQNTLELRIWHIIYSMLIF